MGIAAVLGAGFAFGAHALVDKWTKNLPSVEDASAFSFAQKSTMYASDETTVLAVFQIEERDPVSGLNEVSDYVINGTVATEDARFYEHNGVDTKGIARAVVKNVFRGSFEGASTITQQLVRNTLLLSEMNDISLKRKVREAALALQMEQCYSKNEILLMYLNTINYGDGCYGIEAASQHYFSKSASDLDLAEAATLVGIPQSPNALNPTQHPEACQARRDIVLYRMVDSGTITQEEADAVKSEDIELDVTEEVSENGILRYPYFATYVRDLLEAQFSTDKVFQGGLQIYTTLDVDLQDAAEEACEAQNASMASAMESALIAVDPQNGYIKCMVGGKDFEEDQYNICTQKGRPTGSSFKMFTLVTALEKGISPSTSVDCSSPMQFSDTVRFENFSNINYGIQSIQGATAVSSNTGFVRLQQEVGTANVIATARKMGVTTEYLPEVASLTLGVADITPLDMASAYGVLAADGVYHKPVAVTKIVDAQGETIYDAAEDNPEGERVISGEVAYAASTVLKTVFSSGTATSARPSTGAVVAGKTGTTENFFDHWLVGYTTYLSCAAWIGGRYNVYADSNITANNLWKRFMDIATRDKPVSDFVQHNAPQYNYRFSDKWQNGSGYGTSNLTWSQDSDASTGDGTGDSAGGGGTDSGGTGGSEGAATEAGGSGGDGSGG